MLEPTAVAPSPRSRLRLPGPARVAAILSVAQQLPSGRLTTDELAARFGVSEHWIMARTGIRERRRAGPEERLTDYATRVGAAAHEAAGVTASELDLVIVATMTQDELTPNTAPLVAHALGADHAGAFDVGAACTAFLSELALGAAQIESGRAERVLLVGADFITRITDYDDLRSAPLFADAAGAVVLGEADNGEGAIGPIVLGADGSHGHTIIASHEERKLHMDGPEVFRHAIKRMSEVTLKALEQAGLSPIPSFRSSLSPASPARFRKFRSGRGRRSPPQIAGWSPEQRSPTSCRRSAGGRARRRPRRRRIKTRGASCPTAP